MNQFCRLLLIKLFIAFITQTDSNWIVYFVSLEFDQRSLISHLTTWAEEQLGDKYTVNALRMLLFLMQNNVDRFRTFHYASDSQLRSLREVDPVQMLMVNTLSSL